MQAIGKIFAGVAAGMVLSVILGTLMFQAAMFKQGMELLSIGTYGFMYFLGGILASMILVCFPGARNYKSIMSFYPGAVLVVAGIATAGFMAEAAGAPTSAGIMNMQAMINDLLRVAALALFWVTPAGVTAAYAILYWNHTQSVVAKFDLKNYDAVE